MKSTRVLVANRPRLMRELILETVSDQPDIELVGEVREEEEIEKAVNERLPDFLVVALGQSDQLPQICYRILENHPHLKIIAIAADREATIYYWASLKINSTRIETSEEGVLNALRGKTQPVGGSPWTQ